MITKVGKQTGLSTESLQVQILICPVLVSNCDHFLAKFKFKLMAANSIVQCDQAPEDSISHVQFLKVAASVEAGDVLVSSWDSVGLFQCGISCVSTHFKEYTNTVYNQFRKFVCIIRRLVVLFQHAPTRSQYWRVTP